MRGFGVVFCTHQKLQLLSIQYHVVTQAILHSRNYRSFTRTSRFFLVPPYPLATGLSCGVGSIILLLVFGKRFHWRPFVTHLSLILFQHNRTPFGEIKGLRFHKIPLKSPKAHLRTSRSPQKEHNHHTSVTTGIPDTANSQPESDGSPSPTTSPSKEGST